MTRTCNSMISFFHIKEYIWSIQICEKYKLKYKQNIYIIVQNFIIIITHFLSDNRPIIK